MNVTMNKLSILFLLFCNFTLFSQTQSNYILSFNDDRSFQKFANSYSEIICHSSKIYHSFQYYEVEFCKPLSVSKIFDLDLNIKNVSVNSTVELRATPNDIRYGEQWNLPLIGAELAWNEIEDFGKTIDDRSIVIAVIDFGFETSHPDFINNLWVNSGEIANDGIDNDNNGYIDDVHGLNVVTDDDNHFRHTHGNLVSGIIGAEGNNNTGISGVNWNIEILPISEANNVAKIIEAYGYIYDLRKKYNDSDGEEGAYIVATNLSQGIPFAFAENYASWCELYDKLGEVGILSVSATDNEEYNVDEFGDMPSTCQSEFLITVTSTNQSDQKAARAAYGPINIDLGAPGEDILTLGLNENYQTSSGASVACPHVAGTIGLLYSLNCQNLIDQSISAPNQTARLVKKSILSSVKSINSFDSLTVSGGRLDIFEAVKAIANECNSETGISSELSITSIGPNPFFDGFQINYTFTNLEEHNVKLFNKSGKLIYDTSFYPSLFQSSVIQISIGNIPQDVYFIVLSNDEDIVSSRVVKM